MGTHFSITSQKAILTFATEIFILVADVEMMLTGNGNDLFSNFAPTQETAGSVFSLLQSSINMRLDFR